ncbi:DNA topoisomerase VI subunit B [Candidatus Bathyarchaeota archaeon]|jgi:DNA topoisomerase-6 subunit B|nr:DNA topoisomerase VI subunit B [Candidatus Bathyarchaeota archaeon]MDP6047867.1 DNA topoisomerase VI subunit B [Candidatus Bathyarchaeota archaeon]MDP7443617.1 DNA topoisomerase VI subunit B [Candidatus Bathyarchaeota archaeon]|tara:strand:+ start:552 stop:2126 length:1575 start_codon:yes stop_codon:yes gene_type:complete
MTEIIYQSISPSDFFYRNREIAGFSNPSRAIYASVRELLENALDACERQRVPPDIFLRLTEVSTSEGGTNIYIMRIEDNGTGLPPKQIPSAFCRVFYGSKYTLQQARGTFGLGGTITILYGQITTHQPVVITSSTGGDIHEFTMMIDIERNEPMILKHKVMENKKGWRGTVVHLQMEGDYSRIKRRLLDYLKQTAMVSPYADITFVDPMGRLFRFERGTETMPPLPQPVKPHPHGIDVENFRRLVTITKARSMKEFMTGHFQGVGSKTADRFLKSAGIRNKTRPNSMEPEDIVTLVRAAKDFKDFKRPDATCLSPIGEELLENGIRKELELTENDFLKVVSRKPSTYLGFPFIVETAIATGPTIRKQFKTGTTIIRFANRIPLLFDESSGVIWKVVNKNIHWNTYNVSSDTPMVVVVHVCSTKIPYKTVGKEYMADQPQVEKEITNVIRTSARSLRLFISRSIRIAKERRRLDIFAKYLPKIAEFSTKLSDKETPPDIKPLLIAVGGKIPDVKKKINEVSTIDG